MSEGNWRPEAGKAVRVLGGVALRLFRSCLSTEDRLALHLLCSPLGGLTSPRTLTRRLNVFYLHRREPDAPSVERLSELLLRLSSFRLSRLALAPTDGVEPDASTMARLPEVLLRLRSLRLSQLSLGLTDDLFLAGHALALIRSQAPTLRVLKVHCSMAPLLPQEPLEVLPKLRRLTLVEWPECDGLLALAPPGLRSLEVFSLCAREEGQGPQGDATVELQRLAATLQRLPRLKYLRLDTSLEKVWEKLEEKDKTRLSRLPRLESFSPPKSGTLPKKEILSGLVSPVRLSMTYFLSERFGQLRPSALTSIRALRLTLHLGRPDNGPLGPAIDPCFIYQLRQLTQLRSLTLCLRVSEDERLVDFFQDEPCHPANNYDVFKGGSLSLLPLHSLYLCIFRFSPIRLEPLTLHLPQTLKHLVLEDRVWYRKERGCRQPVPLETLAEKGSGVGLSVRLGGDLPDLRSLQVFGHPAIVEGLLGSSGTEALESLTWDHCHCGRRHGLAQPGLRFAGRRPDEAFRRRLGRLRSELKALLHRYGLRKGYSALLSATLRRLGLRRGVSEAVRDEVRRGMRQLGLCTGPKGGASDDWHSYPTA